MVGDRRMKKEILAVIRNSEIDIDTFFQSLSPEKQAHCQAVAQVANQLLQWAAREDPAEYGALAKLPYFFKAALYHDIGFVLLPNRLLEKQEELTAAEFRVIQQHAVYGGSILERLCKVQRDPEQVAFWALASEIALGHHERWDGKGYPYGQLANAVPLSARLIAIAGAFDDMTRGACYRMPLPAEYALLEINQNAGTQFDPALAHLFTQHFEAILFPPVESAV